MTANQIAYQRHLETARANAVSEMQRGLELDESRRHSISQEQLKTRELTELERSNRAVEKETSRHNVVTETETRRSNLAREWETYRSNSAREMETQRSNISNETIKRGQLALDRAKLNESIRATNENLALQYSKLQTESLLTQRGQDLQHKNAVISANANVFGSLLGYSTASAERASREGIASANRKSQEHIASMQVLGSMANTMFSSVSNLVGKTAGAFAGGLS